MTIYEPYLTNYGTRFGAYHSAVDFGLYPRSKPMITAPEIQSNELEVPGRDGRLDLTQALDGMVHYYNREGTFEYTCFDRKNWDSTYHEIKNKLHGKKMQIVIDEEKDCYYIGRITIDEPEYNAKIGAAYFAIHANMEPFKFEFSDTDEDWLWDPFNFKSGRIRNYHTLEIGANSITVHRAKNPLPRYESINTYTISGKKFTIRGSSVPTVPNIVVSSGSLSVSYTNNEGTQKTVALTTGSNEDKMLDLILQDDSPCELTFSGTGTIAIQMKTGWL